MSNKLYNYKEKPCRTCGVIFMPNNSSHLHCSEDCLAKSMRRTYLKRNYGLSVEEYDRLFEEQKGVCAICHNPGFKINKHAKDSLCVDHCHSSGKVRALLCPNCNRGLGLFQDNAELLDRAARFIENKC